MITSNVIQLPRVEPRARAEPVAVLDIGTSKMCCLIARLRSHRLELLGGGYQLAEGLRAGGIVDTEAAEASILAVVHEAEQQAGRTVREIVLGLSGGRLESMIKAVDLDLGGRAVGAADIRHALALARAQARGEGREVLHALPVEITVDDSPRLRDARGMVGQRRPFTPGRFRRPCRSPPVVHVLETRCRGSLAVASDDHRWSVSLCGTDSARGEPRHGSGDSGRRHHHG